MSVRLIYGKQEECPLIQELGGYCFCRPNVNTHPRPPVKGADKKIMVNTAEFPNVSEEVPIELTVDFGIVPVGSSDWREIGIINSRSNAPFKTVTVLPWKNTGIDRPFRIIVPGGSLGAWDGQTRLDASHYPGRALSSVNQKSNKVVKLKAIFEPELPTMNYTETFLIWIDNYPIRFEVNGQSEGPSVCLSENVINFGGQHYSEISRRWFKMENNSGCEAHFQFDNDNTRSTFKLCPTSGVIPPFMSLIIEATFQAQKPQTFYKRVTCLIHHQQPQYVDLVGICIPRPLFGVSPIGFCIATEHTLFLPFPTESNDEYFESHKFWGIHFSTPEINFGYQAVLSKNGAESLNASHNLKVTNNLPYDVIMDWYQDPTGLFLINPQTCVISTSQSVNFDVHFQPHFPDTFFSGLLECFVYPMKQLWPANFGPPWECIRKDNFFDQKITTPLNLEIEEMKRTSVVSGQLPIAEIVEVPLQDYDNFIEISPVEPTGIDTLDARIESFETISTSSNKMKGKKKQKKKDGKVKSVVSSPAVLPPSEVKRLSKHKSRIQSLGGGSLPSLRIAEEPVLEEEEDQEPVIEATVEEPAVEANSRLFPLHVTVKHLVGGVKKTILLDQEMMKGSSISSVLFDIENKNNSLRDYKEGRTTFVLHKKSRYEKVDSAPIQERWRSVGNEHLGSYNSQANEALGEYLEELRGEAGSTDSMQNLFVTSAPQELGIPLCLNLRVAGHTFQNHTMVPHYKIPKRIVMPPTWPLNEICRSFMIRNVGDLPLYFEAGIVEKDDIYRIKPNIGVIPPNFNQIVFISMLPVLSSSSLYVHDCHVEFNLSDKNQINMRGVAEHPSIELVICSPANEDKENENNEIICPETIPGCGSEAEIEILSNSRFHFLYKFFSLNQSDDELKIFEPTPLEGIMSPYETVKIKWKFTPQNGKMYSENWKVKFKLLQSRAENPLTSIRFELPLLLTGIGSFCELKATPDNLEFELVEIFNEREMYFTVTNLGNVSVVAELRVMHEDWLQYYPSSQYHPNIRISPKTLVLGGLEEATVGVMVRPDHNNFQKYYIEYSVKKTECQGEQVDTAFKKLVDLSFIGDHATFKVIDLMLIGRHPIWDAEQCWSMFSVDKLNECLHPSKNAAQEGLVPKIPKVNFRFPPAPVNSDPAIVTLLLKNTDHLRGYWDLQILPPKDTEIIDVQKKKGAGKWVFDGNPSENKQMLKIIWGRKLSGDIIRRKSEITARHAKLLDDEVEDEMILLTDPHTTLNLAQEQTTMHHPRGPSNLISEAMKDAELFKASPLKGTMGPGESQQISFRYSYKKTGHHHSCLLIRVHPAIYIWVELFGTTLQQNEPCAQLIHNDLMEFHPVCLMDMDPPVQMFWLFNGGNAPSKFQVDPELFDKIRKENFGHEVFECLNPQGVIPPRGWAPICIRFSPIELLEYSIKLNVNCDGLTKGVILKGQAVLTPAITLNPESYGGGLIGLRRKHQLIDPLVPVTISPSQIVFSHFVPTGQTLTSVVFLTNLSAKNKISFIWPVVEIEGGGSIKFFPDAGVIRALEQATIRVVVTGGKIATIFSRMIRCALVDETALAKYEFMNKVWESHKIGLLKTTATTPAEADARLMKKFNGRPEKPMTFSRVLSVKVYVGSVFGLLDTVIPREQIRMTYSDQVLIPLGKKGLKLLPFGRQLCREVLSDMLWDMINSPNFIPHLKRMSDGTPPFYYEYKSSDMQRKLAKKGIVKPEPEPLVHFPRKACQDILEQVIFNLVQEVVEDFYPGKTDHEIKQVQPEELIDIKNYHKNMF